MDHTVAVGADNLKIGQPGEPPRDELREREEMVNLREAFSKCTVHRFKVEATAWDLADQPTFWMKRSGLAQLGPPKAPLTVSVPDKPLSKVTLGGCPAPCFRERNVIDIISEPPETSERLRERCVHPQAPVGCGFIRGEERRQGVGLLPRESTEGVGGLPEQRTEAPV